MNLDNPSDFNSALNKAVNLGIMHVGVSAKRATPHSLMNMLGNHFGVGISHRRFHIEILNRAYGLAFINQKKMQWVKNKAQHEK